MRGKGMKDLELAEEIFMSAIVLEACAKPFRFGHLNKRGRQPKNKGFLIYFWILRTKNFTFFKKNPKLKFSIISDLS